jgi:hypothetical protein
MKEPRVDVRDVQFAVEQMLNVLERLARHPLLQLLEPHLQSPSDHHHLVPAKFPQALA